MAVRAGRYHEKPFRVIWFAVLEDLAQDPGCLAQWQRRIGLDTLWLESALYHTAGFRLSDEVWRRSPFYDWRARPELAVHRRVRHVDEPRFPVLPGVLGGADDANLRRLLDIAHGLGLEVWGHLGLWSYGSAAYPELGVRQLSGRFVSLEEAPWGDCFCPSKPQINHWVQECLSDVISRYDIDGLEIDHARYPPPASIPNLWVCACDDCARQAAGWGIDLGAMAQALEAAWASVRSQPPQAILAALDDADTLLQALDSLLGDDLASRWFALRARHLSSALTGMAQVAHRAARRPFAFGIDVFPPSVASLAGHAYSELAELDYLTGGVGMIGWGAAGPDASRQWTRALCRHWPSLDERDLLRRLHRLLGYQGLPLPATAAALDDLDARLNAMVSAREIAHMAQARPSGLRVYPPLPVAAMGECAADVLHAAVAEGMQGVALSGLEALPPGVERQLHRYAAKGGSL